MIKRKLSPVRNGTNSTFQSAADRNEIIEELRLPTTPNAQNRKEILSSQDQVWRQDFALKATPDPQTRASVLPPHIATRSSTQK